MASTGLIPKVIEVITNNKLNYTLSELGSLIEAGNNIFTVNCGIPGTGTTLERPTLVEASLIYASEEVEDYSSVILQTIRFTWTITADHKVGDTITPVELPGADELQKSIETLKAADTTLASRATALETRATNLESSVSALEDAMAYLDLVKADGFLESYADGQSSPVPTATYGDKEFLKQWQPVLINHEDNANTTTRIRGVLKKNNYLQYKGGGYAPTIGITETQRAECDVALYLDSSASEQYCEAGAFDAETFWTAYKNTQKLYNADGDEVRILKPWETTETKYSIQNAYLNASDRPAPLWLVDNIKGKSEKVWKGILTESAPHFVDGVDVSKWKLAPTALSPCPITTIGGKTRTFFYLYNTGDSNTNGEKGRAGCEAFYNIGRTFPRTSDCHQVNNMNWARANNADTTKPYPFAEGGYHALNTLITSMECLFGTKYLHNNNLFGSGISTNDACSNESTWKANGGVRYKVSGASSWSYCGWSSSSHGIYYASGSRINMSQTLNYERAKEQCMESQMAASYAAELGIAENTEFEFYGNTYWYKNVPGGTALLDGGMDVKVFKLVSTTFSAYNSSGEATTFEVEACLRMSLINGMNLVGDIFAYWGGGAELVETNTKYTSASGQQGGNPIKAYIEPDQTKWATETAGSKSNLGVFDFESQYEYIGEGENYSRWATTRYSYTPLMKTYASGIGTGECFFSWLENYKSSTIGTRIRCAFRFRGTAHTSHCSPRNLSALTYCLNATRLNGGSACSLLDSAGTPQA